MSSDLFDARTFASHEEAVEFIANVLEASTEYSIIAIDSECRIGLWNERAGDCTAAHSRRSWASSIRCCTPRRASALACSDDRWRD